VARKRRGGFFYSHLSHPAAGCAHEQVGRQAGLWIAALRHARAQARTLRQVEAASSRK